MNNNLLIAMLEQYTERLNMFEATRVIMLAEKAYTFNTYVTENMYVCIYDTATYHAVCIYDKTLCKWLVDITVR